VTLQEVGVSTINISNFNKDIINIESSFTNVTEVLPTMENKLECYTKDNIELLCEHVKMLLPEQEIMLIYASKKIKFENEMNQELAYMKYMLAYIILTFKLLNKGGSLMLRTYDQNIPFTCSLLFLLYKNFDQITIIKPLASNLHSAVTYIVQFY
jgi:cap1 methyltransferase